MKLRSISAVGLKGPNFSHQLSEATAIIGPNAVGKTRILQAIRLALAGWLPECGKTVRATWELASGPEMIVRVDFDNSAEIMRRFWLEGEKLRLTEEFAPLPFAKEAIGFENLPLLNDAEYFGLSDTDRTVYVFERIKLPDSYTPESIIAECERISFEEEHSEQVQKAKGGLVRDVEEAFESPDVRFPGAPAQSSAKPSVQQALSDAIETFRERFTYWNKRAKETIGAVKTLTELKLREKECSTDTLTDLDRQMAEKQKELDRLNTLKGEMTAKRDEAERTKARIKQIRERLDADRTDYPKSLEKVRQKNKEAHDKLVEVPSQGGLDEMRASLRDSDQTLRKIVASLEQQNEIISKATERMSELADMKCCPWCKSKGKGWQANLESELNTTINKAGGTLTEGETLAKGLRKSVERLGPEIEAIEAAIRSNDSLNAEIVSLEQSESYLLQEQSREETRRTELGEELSSLNMIPVEKDLVSEITAIETKRVEAALAVSALNGRKTAAVQLAQDLKRAAQAELEHQDASAQVLVIKAIAKLLKEKREAMIEEAFADLLTTANKLTRGILKTDLCLHESTIGMWNGGKFVPHRVFSGTEKALTYIAIAVALSSTAPLKLVILDEFGRLDTDNQYRVLLRLSILVADGVIDQFIVVGTSLPGLDDSQIHLEVIRVKS